MCGIAHDYILEGLWITVPHPRRFLGHVGRTPYRTHSLGDSSEGRRGKGLKTVCLGPTRTSDTLTEGKKTLEEDMPYQ